LGLAVRPPLSHSKLSSVFLFVFYIIADRAFF